MRSSDDNFEARVTEIVRNVVGSEQLVPLNRPGNGSGPGTTSLTHEQVSRYWRCRRSLRIWPIGGPDLEAAVSDFLERILGLDNVGTITVRRVVEPRSKIKDEVVVEFETAPLRDSIKALGYKLEGMAAGIRIEVPNFLRSDFHALQNLSYKLKLTSKDMKRSLKFDDESLGMVLDIQMPGEDWRRIRPEQARQAGRSDPSLRAGPEEMSGDMIAGVVRTGRGASSSVASGSNSVPLGGRGD